MRVCLLPLLFMGISGRPECSSSENAAMQGEFTDCATQLAHAHFKQKEGSKNVRGLEEATCKLFSQTIEECGRAWNRCHDGEDIRRMKDMYINHLVAQYGHTHQGVDVNSCQVVREYRESGRQDEDYRDEDLCSGAKTDEMTRKFQDCSHSTSSSAYQVVMDIIDPTSITETLCKSLTTIGTVCAKTLKECYNKEDLERMTNDHLREMKSFLLQFVEGKVKQDSLSNCPVLKNIDRPSEAQVFEDYDRTNDINGNEPVHNTMNEEHLKESIEFNLEDIEMVREDTTQVEDLESAPEIINTSPTVKLPVATTADPIELSKIESLKAEPENSTKVETASQQKMTRDMDNSSPICLAERGVLIVSLVFSLMSCYV